MYKNFEQQYEAYQLNERHQDFLEWCRIKFNIEESEKKEFKNYKDFASQLGIKEYTYKGGKMNQLERLKVFADIEIVGQKYSIVNVKYPEQQEYMESGNSPWGGYQTIFKMLFNHWFNTRNYDDYFPSSEEIAIEMGLLVMPYNDLKSRFDVEKIFRNKERTGEFSDIVSHEFFNHLQQIDWERRMLSLIEQQLKQMMSDKKNNKWYNISETWVQKTIRKEIYEGEERTVITQGRELSRDERRDIYEQIKSLSTDLPKDATIQERRNNNTGVRLYMSELRKQGIYPVWQVIATPNHRGLVLETDFKEFLIKILLQNKQCKVHRSFTSLGSNIYGIRVDDRTTELPGVREDLYIMEMLLDGSSLYKEIIDSNGEVDYVRLVSGRKIEEIQQRPLKQIADLENCYFEENMYKGDDCIDL